MRFLGIGLKKRPVLNIPCSYLNFFNLFFFWTMYSERVEKKETETRNEIYIPKTDPKSQSIKYHKDSQGGVHVASL